MQTWAQSGLEGLDLHTYPWDVERMEPDIDAAAKLIREIKPSVALFGQSVFLFPTPLEELSDAAHEVGASVMYDAAHVLGLVAGGVFRCPPRRGRCRLPAQVTRHFQVHGFLISDSDDPKMHRETE